MSRRRRRIRPNDVARLRFVLLPVPFSGGLAPDSNWSDAADSLLPAKASAAANIIEAMSSAAEERRIGVVLSAGPRGVAARRRRGS